MAVKVLSTESRQGVREFLTELTIISDIKHENLVRLYGCCVEGINRILVYPYMENNSLAQTLLGMKYTSYYFFSIRLQFFGTCTFSWCSILLFWQQIITVLASSYLHWFHLANTLRKCRMPLLKNWWLWSSTSTVPACIVLYHTSYQVSVLSLIIFFTPLLQVFQFSRLTIFKTYQDITNWFEFIFLAGRNPDNLEFNWQTRVKLCLGVARGLSFLHDEIRPPIIHRDIKASNILLDKDLTPKISDFGLAKLLPPNATHVSTRVAGTMWVLHLLNLFLTSEKKKDSEETCAQFIFNLLNFS